MRSSRARESRDMGAPPRFVQAGRSRVGAGGQRGCNPSWSRSCVEKGRVGAGVRDSASKLAVRRRRRTRRTSSDSPLDARLRRPHCDIVMPSPPRSRPPADPSRVNRFQPSQAYLARTGQPPATPPVARADTPPRPPVRSAEGEKRAEGGERRMKESRDARAAGAGPGYGVRQEAPATHEKPDVVMAEPQRE